MTPVEEEVYINLTMMSSACLLSGAGRLARILACTAVALRAGKGDQILGFYNRILAPSPSASSAEEEVFAEPARPFPDDFAQFLKSEMGYSHEDESIPSPPEEKEEPPQL